MTHFNVRQNELPDDLPERYRLTEEEILAKRIEAGLVNSQGDPILNDIREDKADHLIADASAAKASRLAREDALKSESGWLKKWIDLDDLGFHLKSPNMNELLGHIGWLDAESRQLPASLRQKEGKG